MIIGHKFQWQYLNKAAEAKRVPHAFLFSGEESIGKRKVAFEFAELILSCKGESLEKGINPDFHFIKPELKIGKKQISRQIQISQVRELNSFFNLTNFNAPFKVAIIDDAHFMKQDAQSSFLKLLEEPRGNSVFILISSFPRMILPTIISRTQVLKFYKVPVLEIKNYLEKENISKKAVSELLRFYEGKPGRTMNFVSNPEELENQKKMIGEIIKLSKADLALRFQYVESLVKNSENLNKVLNIWTSYFREILFKKVKKEPCNFENYSLKKIRNLLNLMERLNFLSSSTNINQRLALEILMLEL